MCTYADRVYYLAAYQQVVNRGLPQFYIIIIGKHLLQRFWVYDSVGTSCVLLPITLVMIKRYHIIT